MSRLNLVKSLRPVLQIAEGWTVDLDIFHPSAWSSFSTSDLEGADYRACANFGSLYN
jgi:hypothetical protein